MKIRFKFGIACFMILVLPAVSVFSVFSAYLHNKREAFQHTTNLVLNNHKIELDRNLENIQVLESFMMLLKQIDRNTFNQLVMKANINSTGTTLAFDKQTKTLFTYGAAYPGDIDKLISTIDTKLSGKELISFALKDYITYAKQTSNDILLIYLVPLSYIKEKITRGYPNICVMYQFGASQVSNPVCSQSSDPWQFSEKVEFNLLEMDGLKDRKINQTYSVELKSLISSDYYILLTSAIISLLAIYIVSFILRQRQLAKEEKEVETLENKVRLATVNALNHEIRTPIAMLKMYINKLKADHSHDQHDPCHLNDIAWVCDTIENIATSCLLYSRTGFDNATISTTESPFNLPLFKSKISDFFHSYPQTQGEKKLIFHCRGNDSFSVDTEKLFQIVTNTLGNSLKYGADGDIHCHIKIARDQQHLIILLQDQGKKYTRQALQELVNPFNSKEASHCSTGIGIFLCKNIVSGLGGKFFVRSPQQGGLSVLVRFPINRQVPQSTLNNHCELQGRKLLIVEDSDFICQHYYAEFASLNMQIEMANNGEEAIRKNVQFQADIIMSDYHLPDYCLETMLSELLAQYPQAQHPPRIIVNSANRQEEIELSFLSKVTKEKTTTFIQKPVTLAKLASLSP